MDARRYVKVAQDIYIDTVGPENAKRKVPLAEILACLVIGCILVAILFPAFSSHCGSSRRVICQSNLKQMALGIIQYNQDYDGRYPPATVYDVDVSTQPPYARPYGWADALQPYLKSTQIYHCSANETEHCTNPMALNFTDYWLNGNLYQAYEKDIHEPSATILYGEGNDGHDATNARYSLRALPPSWKNDRTTPAWRHLDGANYCYTDGHVKWRKGEQATLGNTSNFTFALEYKIK